MCSPAAALGSLVRCKYLLVFLTTASINITRQIVQEGNILMARMVGGSLAVSTCFKSKV